MEAPLRSQLTFGAILVAAFVVSAAIIQGIILRAPASSGARNGLYAVFLTNSQVYFGRIDKESSDKLWLKNIYYIQPAKEGEKAEDISLLKLGNELHGPEDMMEINRAQVMFVEKLKDDGKVSKAIQAYQQK